MSIVTAQSTSCHFTQPPEPYSLLWVPACIHLSFFSDWLIGNMWDVKPEYLDSMSPEITFKSSAFISIRLSDSGQLILASICLKTTNFPSNVKIKLKIQD